MTVSTSLHRLLCTIVAVVSPVVSVQLKESIFNSGTVELDDFTRLPATVTIPLYDCSNSYRLKPGIPNAYEVYHNYQWHVHFCQKGLLWNDTLCRCHYPNGQIPLIQCNDFREASTEPTDKYKQFVNGQWIIRHCSHSALGLVWDQQVCQCVWSTDSKNSITGQDKDLCDVMLNMTFEDGILDYGKNSFVEMRKRDPIKTPTLSKEESVDGNKAAYFNDTTLKIWYFAARINIQCNVDHSIEGNEMGPSLRVNFRFKLTHVLGHDEKYQMIISNGCRGSAVGFTTPSLAIGYWAADQTYVLAFETASARKAIVCSSKADPYNWHVVSLVYNDGTLILSENDNLCIVSREFSGPIQRTHCPLTVGADPLLEGSVLKGYLDNLLIVRHCRTIDIDKVHSVADDNGPMPQTLSAIHGNLIKQQKLNLFDVKVFLDQIKWIQESQIPSTKYMSEFPDRVDTQPKDIEHSDQIRSLNFTKLNPYIGRNKMSAKTMSYTNSPDKLVASNHLTEYDTKDRPPRIGFKMYERDTDYAIDKVNKDSSSPKMVKVTSTKENSDKILRKLDRLTNLINTGMSAREMYSSKINSEHDIGDVKPKRQQNYKQDNFDYHRDSINVSLNPSDSIQLEGESMRSKKRKFNTIRYVDKNKENGDNDRIPKQLWTHDKNLETFKNNNHRINNIYHSDEEFYSNTHETVKPKPRNNDLVTESKYRINSDTTFARESKDINSRDNDISGKSKDSDPRDTYFSTETNKDSDVTAGSKGTNSYFTAEFNDKSTKINRDYTFVPDTGVLLHTRNIRNKTYLLDDSTRGRATSMDDVLNRDTRFINSGVHGQLNDRLHSIGGRQLTDRSDRLESYESNRHGIISNENKGHALENNDKMNVMRNDWDHVHGAHEPNKHTSRHDTQDRHRGHKYKDLDISSGLKNAVSEGDDGMQILNNAEYNNNINSNKENSNFEHTSSSVTSDHAPLGRKQESGGDNNALPLEYRRPDVRDHDRVSRRWYDVGASQRHARPPHLIGIDLSHGSAFIIDRSYRRNQKLLEPKPNFIKGRRRSGSKKNTWYDKANT